MTGYPLIRKTARMIGNPGKTGKTRQRIARIARIEIAR
jgi:hypothetical protein